MIVIPMAGSSSRFTKAGYDRPKWMLPIAGRPLLDWSLLSFSSLFSSEKFVIIFLDAPGNIGFIEDRLEVLGIRNVDLVSIPLLSRGQAETVAQGLERYNNADVQNLTIFNIDTIRPRYKPSPALREYSGWLECFIGEGDHWSFVRPDAHTPSQAAEVVEKKRISNLCCTGIYYFKTLRLFTECLSKEISDLSCKELFVAPLYRHMIEEGKLVGYDVIGQDEVFFCGTPVEYESLKKKEETMVAQFDL